MRKLPVVPLCRRPAVLLETPNQQHLSRVPASEKRGVSRSSRTLEAGCGGRFGCALTNAAEADGEIVWSWRPDAGAKFSRTQFRESDGGKRARSPGRARISRKTIAQGMPVDCGVPVVANACAFYTAHAAAGALRSRHSLRPLFSLRANVQASPGPNRAAGMRRHDLRRRCLKFESTYPIVIRVPASHASHDA